MTVLVYPAFATAEAGALRARFVDFDGLEATAANGAELLRLARDRLSQELQRREAAGDTWPEATPLERLAAPPGGSVLLIDVSVDDTPVRLTISLGERLLKRIDEDAQARSMTRSGYLALGARRLLDQAASGGGAGGHADSQRLHEEIAALGRRVSEALGPNSPVGLTLAELDSIALDGLRRLGQELRSAMKPRRQPPSSAARGDGDPPPAPDRGSDRAPDRASDRASDRAPGYDQGHTPDHAQG